MFKNATNSASPPLCINSVFLEVLSSSRIIFNPEFRKESSLSLASRISYSKRIFVNVVTEGTNITSVPVLSVLPVTLSALLGAPSE